MPYCCNNQGVEALKSVKKRLQSNLEECGNAANEFAQVFLDCSANDLGPHAKEALIIARNTVQIYKDAKDSVDYLCNGIEYLIQSYIQIIEAGLGEPDDPEGTPPPVEKKTLRKR